MSRQGNQSTAITSEHLPVHVTALKDNEGLGMAQEYESIHTDGDYSWHEANREENKLKNRYANVIAYDHSRVVLATLPGVPGSDYINANFINGYRKSKSYVATQGPLPKTFTDFWRMVWEQNSRVIVMMTRLEERARVKCDQYWPSKGQQLYPMYGPLTGTKGSAISKAFITGAFQVTLKEANSYAYYTTRVLQIQKFGHPSEVTDKRLLQNMDTVDYQRNEGLVPVSEVREIRHYQFTAWPDYGAPDQAQPLLLFIRKVNQGRAAIQQQIKLNSRTRAPPEVGPTVVHCSAGVGRTGAFIVIDSQLERLKQEHSVDVYGAVNRMRCQRNFMVQTEEQYAFLYDILVEAVQVRLRQPAPTAAVTQYVEASGGNQQHLVGQKLSGLDLEFKRLSINLRTTNKFSSAQTTENTAKNRFANLMPFEENRVILGTIRGVRGSDYINASFVDGFWKRKSYIATQSPLAQTVDDFWRMIWEQNSPIIVVLCRLKDAALNRDNNCHQYWPSDRPARYNQLNVEPMVEYNMPSFVLREFRVSDVRDGQMRTVRQFQFTDWPENASVPRSAEALIDLIGQVHKTQSQFGQDGPITVHCNNGVGLTGVFIALSLILERMRVDGEIDLFLMTRLLRTQRVQLVQTVDQYAFCYAATLEYLAQFDQFAM
ncbi:hypothetical protein Ciccas_001747 [Cichlidogyrus casuarinus]|uniref:protein-tyrosine-phosphatase n=1 Tax=Cichlidogyrus casuarinus TaxID=1844966 RepID=A0ABD2QK89_9PLAT